MAFERRLDGGLVFSIVAAGILSFTGVVIETAMNVTFPSLMKEFSISTSMVQWVTTGYLLVLAVVIPASGYLKARFPMKGLFLGGASLFILGTLLGAWSPSFPVLLLGRFLQGGGTGVALPLMFNIILEQAPLNRLGVMVGTGMLVCALAPAVGPSAGGYIVSLFGWCMIFWAVLPLLVLSFFLGGFFLRQSSEIRKVNFDGKGLLLLAFSFTLLLLGCTELGKGTLTAGAASFLALSLSLLWLFYRHEKGRIKKEIVPFFMYPFFPTGRLRWAYQDWLCCSSSAWPWVFLFPISHRLLQGKMPLRRGAFFFPVVFWGRSLHRFPEGFMTVSAPSGPSFWEVFLSFFPFSLSAVFFRGLLREG